MIICMYDCTSLCMHGGQKRVSGALHLYTTYAFEVVSFPELGAPVFLASPLSSLTSDQELQHILYIQLVMSMLASALLTLVLHVS